MTWTSRITLLLAIPWCLFMVPLSLMIVPPSDWWPHEVQASPSIPENDAAQAPDSIAQKIAIAQQGIAGKLPPAAQDDGGILPSIAAIGLPATSSPSSSAATPALAPAYQALLDQANAAQKAETSLAAHPTVRGSPWLALVPIVSVFGPILFVWVMLRILLGGFAQRPTQ